LSTKVSRVLQTLPAALTVLLECFAAAEPQLVIFGAGHVCHALVSITSRLSLRTLVVDSRPELLAVLPTTDRVRTLLTDDPVAVCSTLDDHSLILVMTHDHRLDYSLVRTLLEPWRWSLLGMIGSATKAHRFRMRLRNDGISEGDLHNLQSPIGISGLKGKLPMEVAVSVSAGLMQHLQGIAQPRVVPDWRATKALLKQAREA
jgi:xanthine dehydrogenase accessory factor